MADEKPLMRVAKLSEEKRKQRGLELAQVLTQLADHEEHAKDLKSELKERADALKREVKRLRRAVIEGQEEVEAQEKLLL